MLKDKDIREALFDYLESLYGTVRILEEKIMGDSRADVVMVTKDKLIGIEIKSDADSYARLSRQIRDYEKYFDQNYVAVGSTHAMHIEEHVPDSFGIITVEEVDGRPDFYLLRKPGPNPKLSMEKKIEILWRPELVRIQERYAMPRYKRKSKSYVAEKILETVPKEELDLLICAELFERDYNTIADEIEQFRKEQKKRPKRRSQKKKSEEFVVENYDR